MNSVMNPNPVQLYNDPDYLLFDLMLPQQKALWVRINPEILKESSFLDQRVLPKALVKIRTPISWLAASKQIPEQPLRWIFHCGHVGSTLLSRLLDGEQSRVLREPQVLRSLASSRREVGFSWSPWSLDEWWQTLAGPSIHSLSRHKDSEYGVLIKATSATSNMMGDILQRRQQDLAVALAMPLDLYLTAMQMSPTALQDIQGFSAARIQQIRTWLQRPPAALSALSQDQLTAMSWLVSVWPLMQASQQFAERCHYLSFASLMSNPQTAAREVATALNWHAPVDAEPLMKTYAKAPDRAYDSQRRWQQMSELRLKLKAKSEDLQAWLQNLMRERHDISQFLEQSLAL